jgi:ABC-type multidrug transport system permease subunit
MTTWSNHVQRTRPSRSGCNPRASGRVTELGVFGRMKVFGYICITLTALFLLYAAWTCWFFRDGLGPDSVESIGSLAWSRFWEDFRFALLLSAPVLFFGAWCIRRKRKVALDET